MMHLSTSRVSAGGSAGGEPARAQLGAIRGVMVLQVTHRVGRVIQAQEQASLERRARSEGRRSAAQRLAARGKEQLGVRPQGRTARIMVGIMVGMLVDLG